MRRRIRILSAQFVFSAVDLKALGQSGAWTIWREADNRAQKENRALKDNWARSRNFKIFYE